MSPTIMPLLAVTHMTPFFQLTSVASWKVHYNQLEEKEKGWGWVTKSSAPYMAQAENGLFPHYSFT